MDFTTYSMNGCKTFKTLLEAVQYANQADDDSKDKDDVVQCISFELPTGETVSLDYTLGGEWVLDEYVLQNVE